MGDVYKLKVAAVDPGTVNGAAWIGTYDPIEQKVHTDELVLGNPLVPTGDDGACGSASGSSKKKQAAYSVASELAVWVADKCKEHDVKDVLVETAPQWNIAARICAASTYGVLVGKGIPNVRFSGPKTKHSAIEKFAEHLGITSDLETPSDSLDKTNKKDSAKVRLMNKRNAVRVVKKLLEHSADEKGLAVLAENKKLDDLSDSILLACGMAIKMYADGHKQTKSRKRKTPQK